MTRRAELNEWLMLTLRPAFAGRILPVMEDILLKWRTLMEDQRLSSHGVGRRPDRRLRTYRVSIC